MSEKKVWISNEIIKIEKDINELTIKLEVFDKKILEENQLEE